MLLMQQQIKYRPQRQTAEAEQFGEVLKLAEEAPLLRV